MVGGLIASEIPSNRSPITDLEFEIQLMKDLGVKIFHGKKFGSHKEKDADISVESLRKEGY